MKAKVKHNLIIFEQELYWEIIREKIKQDFGVATVAISWRLKRELEFTVRYHQAKIPGDTTNTYFYTHQEVHLDFFNEAAHSWFVLKYLNLD